jgi:hypothetical protein
MYYVYALIDRENDDVLWISVTDTPDRYQLMKRAGLAHVNPYLVILAIAHSSGAAVLKERRIMRRRREEWGMPVDPPPPPYFPDVVAAIRELIGR